jgi:hypothetical protein
LLSAGNYDPAISVVPDYDIFDRVSDVGLMLTIPEPLSEHRLHDANNSFQNYELQSSRIRGNGAPRRIGAKRSFRSKNSSLFRRADHACTAGRTRRARSRDSIGTPRG